MSVPNSSDMNPLHQRMLQFRVIVHEALMLNCRLYEYLERRLYQLEARKIQLHQESTADTGRNQQSQSRYSGHSSSPASTGYYSSSASPCSPCSPLQHSTFNEQNTSRAYQSQRPFSHRKDAPILTPNSAYAAGGGPQPLTSTPFHYQLDSFRTPIKTARKFENSYEHGCSTGCQRISCPNCKSEFQIEFTVKKLSEK
ncbi:unnamed protein product [Orchesella dallaii]|uniref:Uncharacterized protein n=1 Tax=Orchesella dallaii TaxID=48710 RepID=A0ABP1S1F0_9HEXA